MILSDTEYEYQGNNTVRWDSSTKRGVYCIWKFDLDDYDSRVINGNVNKILPAKIFRELAKIV